MSLPREVRVVEVGPRDGLQNEAVHVPVATRVELIARLARAGVRTIEAGAFVSPKKIPSMAGSEEVFAALPSAGVAAGVVDYPALVPNLRGLARAREAGVRSIALFAAASEAFSQSNTDCSIDTALQRAGEVAEEAHKLGMKVRGYVSCVVACPYEGAIDPAKTAEVCRRLWELGVYEISLGDTIGAGTPHTVGAMLEAVARYVPVEKLAVHFHDTYGQALVNVYAAMEVGVVCMDTSVGGLGGCPYARGATGNLATEDLLYMLHGMGIETGIDFAKLVETGHFILKELGRAPASRVSRALLN